MYLVFVLLAVFSVKLWAFPSIISWDYSPVVVYENKKSAVLKKNTELKSAFVAVTAKKDIFTFKVNIFDEVEVAPNSKIQIVDFADEVGTVADLYLLGGEIRYKSNLRSVTKKDLPLTIKTPFFDLKTEFLAEFIVSLNMREPSAEIKVIEGVVPLEFFAYEKKVSLKSGEKVKFKGFLAEDGGGIKYDYLLNNRKAPKGELLAVEKFDVAGFIKDQEKLKKTELELKLAIKKKAEEKIRKQKEYEDSFLCKKPFAQKDQCAWFFEGEKCMRKRCNVSGRWGDLIDRPNEACKSKKDFYVANCDY